MNGKKSIVEEVENFDPEDLPPVDWKMVEASQKARRSSEGAKSVKDALAAAMKAGKESS
jgi:hypothetical protein